MVINKESGIKNDENIHSLAAREKSRIGFVNRGWNLSCKGANQFDPSGVVGILGMICCYMHKTPEGSGAICFSKGIGGENTVPSTSSAGGP